MQNNEYSSRFAISQTMVKDFRFKSPKKWKLIHIDRQEDIDKPDEGFTFGSLQDTMLFTPYLLEDRFYVGKLKLPSKAIETIVRNCFLYIQKENLESEKLYEQGSLPEPAELIEFDLTKIENKILDYCDSYTEKTDDGEEKVGWNNAWKTETRIATIIKKGKDYFDGLVQAKGRKIITQEMNFEAIELANILRTNSETKKYFVEEEGSELKFQFEIFVNHTCKSGKILPLKGALDILRIDHVLKTIQIVDFKTSYSAFDFLSSVKKYGYATQLSYYDYLLRIWLDTKCKGKFCDYTIINPINIVIDKYDKVPYIYEYSWQDLEMEKTGNETYLKSLYGTYDHNQKIKKGWEHTLELIAWHYFNNFWDYSKELYENKKIKINLLNI